MKEVQRYAIDLLAKFLELELCKIKNPSFTVEAMYRDDDGQVCAYVDDFRVFSEMGLKPGDKYMGIEWREWK